MITRQEQGQSRRVSRLIYAVHAAWTFIQMMHREGYDRGMIGTFGDTFRIECQFTTSLSKLHSALVVLLQGARAEGTRLYDSIDDGVNYFWQSARRDCPWINLMLTDGEDNRSKRYPFKNGNSPELIGRFVGTRFTHERTNFAYLLGVGIQQEQQAKALGTIGHYGNLKALRVEGFHLLEEEFRRVAYEVSVEIEEQGVPIAPGLIATIQTPGLRVTRKSIDYGILIDVSESMNTAV